MSFKPGDSIDAVVSDVTSREEGFCLHRFLKRSRLPIGKNNKCQILQINTNISRLKICLFDICSIGSITRMRYAIEDEFRLSECGYDSPKFLENAPSAENGTLSKNLKSKVQKSKLTQLLLHLFRKREICKNSQKSLTKTKTGCLPGLKK